MKGGSEKSAKNIKDDFSKRPLKCGKVENISKKSSDYVLFIHVRADYSPLSSRELFENYRHNTGKSKSVLLLSSLPLLVQM